MQWHTSSMSVVSEWCKSQGRFLPVKFLLETDQSRAVLPKKGRESWESLVLLPSFLVADLETSPHETIFKPLRRVLLYKKPRKISLRMAFELRTGSSRPFWTREGVQRPGCGACFSSLISQRSQSVGLCGQAKTFALIGGQHPLRILLAEKVRSLDCYKRLGVPQQDRTIIWLEFNIFTGSSMEQK